MCLGEFSNEINGGQVIVPRKVFSNGTHLTHILTHYHSHDPDEKLHYHIDLNNETLHLELLWVFLCSDK